MNTYFFSVLLARLCLVKGAVQIQGIQGLVTCSTIFLQLVAIMDLWEKRAHIFTAITVEQSWFVTYVCGSSNKVQGEV